MHVVYTQNGTTVTVYVNGVSVAAGTGTNSAFNTAAAHQIGAANTTNYFDGYLAGVIFVDGQALDPSYFGQADSITGVWGPKAYSGTYGANGFYLDFSDNSGVTSSTLGKDRSGNGNDWTPNNFSVDETTNNGIGCDSVTDTPTNYGVDSGSTSANCRGNYCTFDPLTVTSNISLSNGNLTSASTSNADFYTTRGTFGTVSGKWYFEVSADSGVFGTTLIGLMSPTNTVAVRGPTTSTATMWSYRNNGNKNNNTTSAAYGNSYTTGNVIGVAWDAEAGKIWFSKDGVWQNSGDPSAGTNEAFSGLTGPLVPFIAHGDTGPFSGNFGQRPFKYAPPTGFKALCTQNLSTPSIKRGDDYFGVDLYTGNGSSQSRSGLRFQPDFAWFKGRSGATDHAIYDAVRGAQKRVETNNSDAEVTSDGGLTSFDSTGFSISSLAQINTNAATYVAWLMKESTTAGFDIVTYSGDNTANRNISHGLGVAPDFALVKRLDAAEDWFAWHQNLTGNAYFCKLNATDAQSNTSSPWGTGNWSSTQFMVTNDGTNNTNASGTNNYIAYLWTEVPGFSKFGSYTGNGNADGPFVWCGFRPRYFLVKAATRIDEWWVLDTTRSSYNQAIAGIMASNDDSEYSVYQFTDLLSNGFKLRSTNSGTNSSGETYVFIAFAENPFKYARAR